MEVHMKPYNYQLDIITNSSCDNRTTLLISIDGTKFKQKIALFNIIKKPPKKLSGFKVFYF